MSRLRLPSVLLMIVALTGCAHETRLISVPAGATFYVDGRKVGPGPLIFKQRSGIPGRSYSIRAELPGYAPLTLTEPVRICPTPANLIMDAVVVGFAFGFCLKDEYVVDFTK